MCMWCDATLTVDPTLSKVTLCPNTLVMCCVDVPGHLRVLLHPLTFPLLNSSSIYVTSHPQLFRWVQLWAQVRPPGVEPCAQVGEVLAWERRPPQREELRAPQVRPVCVSAAHFFHLFVNLAVITERHFNAGPWLFLVSAWTCNKESNDFKAGLVCELLSSY